MLASRSCRSLARRLWGVSGHLEARTARHSGSPCLSRHLHSSRLTASKIKNEDLAPSVVAPPPEEPAEEDVEAETSPARSPSSVHAERERLSKLASVEETLLSVQDHEFHLHHCLAAVIRLSELTSDVSEFATDPRFERILKQIGGRTVSHTVDSGAILVALRAMDSLKGMDREALCFKNLENSLLWRARRSPLTVLVKMLQFVQRRRRRVGDPTAREDAQEDMTERLRQEVIRAFEKRWVEIAEASVFAGILEHPECFAEQFLNRVDDRIVDNAENMLPADLTMILVKMGEKGRRSVPVVKTLTYHLLRAVKDLRAKDVSDCLFALNRLSFKDKVVLMSFCDAVDVSSVVARPVARSLLTSLGQLKLLHKPLLDGLSEWMAERVEELEERDLVAFVITAATLNYQPKFSAPLFKAIEERISYESLQRSRGAQGGSELLWLDVVWSLAVLGKHNSDQLASVLSSDYYNKLLYSHDHRNVGVILKMLNVNAVARFLTPGYSGPTVPAAEDPLLRDVRAVPTRQKAQLAKLVKDAFASLAPPPANATTDANTSMGFCCDSVCLLDGKRKPAAVAGKNLFQPGGVEPGLTKVAVMVASFHDCLLDGSPGGLMVLSRRLLEALDFKVLLVHHREVNPKHTELERIKLMQKKLVSLLESQ